MSADAEVAPRTASAQGELLPQRTATGSLDAIHPRPSWVDDLRQDGQRLWEARHVVRLLTSSQLKTLYQRSALGFLWSLLTPLLMFAVLAFVFTNILSRSIPNFPLYLFSGQIPWLFFSAAVMGGSKSLLSQQRIVRKFPVHRMVFPLVSVTVAAVNMVLVTTALFVLFAALGTALAPQLLLLPVAMLLLIGFVFGVVLISMTLVTYYRDFEYIIPVGLQALFFASPVLLQPRQLGAYRIVMDLNPLTYHIELFRCALYSSSWPDGLTWSIALGSTLAALALGYLVFKRHEHDYVFHL